jgi:POT family proton-dependent oligopeptide transporter
LFLWKKLVKVLPNMTTTINLDNDAIAQAGLADAEHKGLAHNPAKGSIDVHNKEALPSAHDLDDDEDWPDKPTEEELSTLRRVSGPIMWSMWTIAFVELCERFSYYGSSVLYTNFVNHPLPTGSNTGAPVGKSHPDYDPNALPGALGQGPKAAQGISLFNQFFAYIMPLVGAWIADARYGRFWTLHLAIGISTIAHTILVASSAPGVIVKKDSAFAAFIIGMLTLCVGTGFFKANVSPLLAEQNRDTRMRVETRKGERVIVDPAVTNTRIFLYFYLCINAGSLAGQIGMVYVEKYVGFWLAFLIPTALFLVAPFILWSNKKNYRLSPPTGSLLSKFIRMFLWTRKRSTGWHLNWEAAKPSNYTIDQRPAWMTYDDAWIDEVRRGLMACKVFLFLPVFFLAYNQMTGNLTTQAGTMQLHGVPNDVIQNLNPISIVIMIPIIDHALYPGLRKLGIAFTPIKRMTTGFAFSAISMVASAVMQYYIYKKSPCGWHANGTTLDADGEEVTCPPAPINVWAQSLPYILIGLSEIFTNVTSLEYAFSKAPENMRSLVMSVNLFMSAISAAIGQAFTPMSGDPLLVWNYTTVACIAAVGGIAFWLCFRHLDSREDELNMLRKSQFKGTVNPTATSATKTVDDGEHGDE